MSKLAISLCVIFFATTSNASYKSNSLTESLLNEFNEKYEIDNKIAKKAVEDLNTNLYIFKNFSSIESTRLATIIKMYRNDITDGDGNVNITKCDKFVKTVEESIHNVLSSMLGCVEDEVNKGLGYLKNMTNAAEKLLNQLQKFVKEEHQCHENINGRVPFPTAIKCIIKVTISAGAAAVRPKLTIADSVVKITTMAATFRNTIITCAVRNGVLSVFNSLPRVVIDLTKCIGDKIRAHVADAT